MSVTFTVSPGAISGYALSCGHDNGVTGHRFDSYAEAFAFLTAEVEVHDGSSHLAICGDEYCQQQGRLHTHAIEVDPAPALNVSNANAALLLKALGITPGDEGCYGEEQAGAFMDRVKAAQAGSLYADRRLDGLYLVAEHAMTRNLDVHWS